MGRLTRKLNGKYVPIVDNTETDQKLGKYEDYEQKNEISQKEMFELLEIFKNTKINIEILKKSQNYCDYNNKRMNNDLLTPSEFALLKRFTLHETKY